VYSTIKKRLTTKERIPLADISSTLKKKNHNKTNFLNLNYGTTTPFSFEMETTKKVNSIR
jgi:hypothetical protein